MPISALSDKSGITTYEDVFLFFRLYKDSIDCHMGAYSIKAAIESALKGKRMVLTSAVVSKDIGCLFNFLKELLKRDSR